ncbi:MAG TPA: transcriptional regulator [Beijerinckiaceae bacterium]|jgi:HTH-type transcriptional regulator/antitoxin HigA
MRIRRVHDEASHKEALREIERLWNAPPGSEEREVVGVLADLVELYESRHFQVPDADPVEVLEYAISEMGRKELGQVLGSTSRASEVMNRKRALTVDMIDKISRAWHLPVAALAKPYRVDPSARAKPSGTRKPAPRVRATAAAGRSKS